MPAPPKLSDPPAVVPPDEAAQTARELAAAAADLVALRTALDGFDGCQLKQTATQLVFGDGDASADLMLIGEAPGRDEDRQGLPFVGRSGQLLNAILSAIGLQRSQCYITNVIPWRPPGNRTPTPQETEICRPFIERHIELVQPKIVVCLGGAAAKTLLQTTDGIMRLRGDWKELRQGAHTAAAMATLHPAYLLRQPAQKSLVWRDFQAIRARLSDSDAP